MYSFPHATSRLIHNFSEMESQECLSVQLKCCRLLGFFLSAKLKSLGKIFQWLQISFCILNFLLQSLFLVINASDVFELTGDIGNVIRVFNSFVKLTALWLSNDKVATLMHQISAISLDVRSHQKFKRVQKLERRIAQTYFRVAIMIVICICVSPVVFDLIHFMKHGSYGFTLPVRSSFSKSVSSLPAYLLTSVIVGFTAYSTILATVSAI